jgi:hypothetical protein
MFAIAAKNIAAPKNVQKLCNPLTYWRKTRGLSGLSE